MDTDPKRFQERGDKERFVVLASSSGLNEETSYVHVIYYTASNKFAMKYATLPT